MIHPQRLKKKKKKPVQPRVRAFSTKCYVPSTIEKEMYKKKKKERKKTTTTNNKRKKKKKNQKKKKEKRKRNQKRKRKKGPKGVLPMELPREGPGICEPCFPNGPLRPYILH